MNKSYDVSENITEEIINSAAEMFIKLNFCPVPNEYDTFQSWIHFYKDLFQNHNPRLIVMTINRLLKSKEDNVAQQLLLYVKSLWKLKFHQSSSEFDKNNVQVAQILR